MARCGCGTWPGPLRRGCSPATRRGAGGGGQARDGRTAVSGGDDGTVRVWDLAGAAAPRVLTGHTARCRRWRSAARTTRQRAVTAAAATATVRVWDLAAGRCAAGAHRPRPPCLAVAVSADGRTAVSGGYDGMVRVWDLAAGRCAARAHRPHRRGAGGGGQRATGAPRSAAAATARCGCGTWPGPLRSGSSPATPARWRRWRSRATGAPRSAAAATARCGCGTWPRAPRRGLAGHTGEVEAVAVSGGRAHRGHRRPRRHGAGVGPGRGRRAAELTGHDHQV